MPFARLWIAVAAVSLFVSISPAHGAPRAGMPLQAAITDAERLHKPIVIAVGTTWCPACRKLESDILTRTEVLAALDQVYFVQYDADEETGASVAAWFKVDGYPSLIALGDSGLETARADYASVNTPDAFLSFLADARGAFNQTLIVQSGEKSSQKVIATARWLQARGDHKGAAAVTRELLRLKLTPKERAEAESFTRRVTRISSLKTAVITASLREVRVRGKDPSIDDLTVLAMGSGMSRPDICKLLTKPAERSPQAVYLSIAAHCTDVALRGSIAIFKLTPSVANRILLSEAYRALGRRQDSLDNIEAGFSSSTDTEREQLKAEFARIDRDEISTEVLRYSLRASDFWRRLTALNKLADVDTTTPSLRSLTSSLDKLGAAIALKCKRSANQISRMFVVVSVNHTTGSIAQYRMYLEDGTSDELRQCVSSELNVATLPTFARQVPAQTVSIPFSAVNRP